MYCGVDRIVAARTRAPSHQFASARDIHPAAVLLQRPYPPYRGFYVLRAYGGVFRALFRAAELDLARLRDAMERGKHRKLRRACHFFGGCPGAWYRAAVADLPEGLVAAFIAREVFPTKEGGVGCELSCSSWSSPCR